MQNNRSMVVTVLACFTLFLALEFAHKKFGPLIWPPIDPPLPQEAYVTLAGGPVAAIEPISKRDRMGNPEPATPPKKKEEPAKPAEQPKIQAKLEVLPELIGMGWGDKHSHLQVLLTTRGGAVQEVVLPDFDAADREGLRVLNPDGVTSRKLHLVPGTIRERTLKIGDQRDIPYVDLEPGVVKDKNTLAHLAPSSYAMYHYLKPTDERPVDLLGTIAWKVARQPEKDADEQETIFETELAEPFNVQIRKIFSLKRGDYHIGMKIEIRPLEGKKCAKLRYQIVGANGLPIEGEWYASTYRNNIVGFVDAKDRATRELEDAASVSYNDGSDRKVRTDVEGGDNRNRPGLQLRFAGTMVQYFASILCVDNLQVEGQKTNFLEFVRSTPMGRPIPEKSFLDDLTIRAITEELNPEKPIVHQYILYHGPVKVRLLKQLTGEKAVDSDLIDRYKSTLHLEIMTDAPMPNVLGRFASSIYWSDLVVGVTNIIHSLLGLLHSYIPWLGVCIVCVTLLVRGSLHPLSRRQMISQQIMQAKMAKMAPEVKKLQEKYGDDFQTFNQEKTKLMFKSGVNPATMMGGCFLVLLQMPIFMGLYYALQESIFFRLDTFLWIRNLCAPDMLVWWTESVPFVSQPQNLGSGTYLGPYFNILPIITVSLMFYTMMKSMPPPTSDQEKMQRSTMKFMMIFMAFMFYKSPAGLCLYFMASSIWSIIEKKMIPKFPKDPDGNIILPESYNKPKGPRELTGWKKRLADRWKEMLEQAEKQKQHQRNPDTNRRNGKRPRRDR